MSSLKEIKSRIGSVKSTLKITSAMKMVAAAKLRKAQNAINGKLPYEQNLRAILSGMMQDQNVRKVFGCSSEGGSGRVALVLFSSNSSLCGAFNANIIREFHHLLHRLGDEGYAPADMDVYVVGRKIADAARKSGLAIKSDLSEMADKPTYDKAASLASALTDSFSSGEVGKVILLYSHFASHSSQPVVTETYLPFALDDMSEAAGSEDYLYEPDPLAIANELLPLVLRLKIFNVLLDANAAEHAARTMAMQIATDNAQNLIAELTLAYNKGRQSEITSEILDLAGGSLA